MSVNVILVELENPNNRVKAQWLPNELSYSREAKLESVAVVNRSNDMQLHTGGNSSLSINFEFVAAKFFEKLGSARTSASSQAEGQQLVQDIKSYIETTVVKPARYLESLAFGQKVKLIFGELYQNEVWTVSRIETTFSENTSLSFGHLPLKASVKVSLLQDPQASILPSDLRN